MPERAQLGIKRPAFTWGAGAAQAPADACVKAVFGRRELPQVAAFFVKVGEGGFGCGRYCDCVWAVLGGRDGRNCA